MTFRLPAGTRNFGVYPIMFRGTPFPLVACPLMNAPGYDAFNIGDGELID